jgi:uncharacterized RDD family membrane protein YckC
VYFRAKLPVIILAGILAAAPQSRAQSSAPATQSAATIYRIAANDDVLWLAKLSGGQSSLVRRERGGVFDLPRDVARPIVEMCALERGLLAVFTDGAVYHYRANLTDISPERDMPNHRAPHCLTTAGGQVYALLPPEGEPDAAPATAPPRIALYDGRDWRTIASCEPAISGDQSGRLRTRLLVVGDTFVLVWREAGGRLAAATRGRSADAWMPALGPDHAGIAAFWLVTVNVSPTLVGAVGDDSGGEKLVGWRLALSESGEASWQTVDWRWSAPPGGTHVTRLDDAEGFNQQLALLARDELGRSSLLFARDGAEPSEPSADASAIFEAPARAARRHELVRILTFFLLVMLVIGMFVFRRDSMTETLALPPRMALAFSFQRVLGGALDIAPFAWSAALACEVDPLAGLRELSEWGLFAGADSQLPPPAILLWWALTAAGFTLYCGVMEAILGRTIGKLLVGSRVVGSQGRRATLGQAVIRNALRLVELIPQFWVFAFLIVLSRNRQRLGDVFARTVVVRLRATNSGPPQETDSGGTSPS